MNEKKSIFKNSTFWTVIALLFVYPIGVILMWVLKKEWKLWVKILITVIAVLVLGNSVANPSKPSVTTTTSNVLTSSTDDSVKKAEEAKKAEEKTKVDAEKKEAEDAAKTPDVLIKEKYSDKIENTYFTDGVLKIETKGEMAVWDENDFITRFPREYFDIFWSGIFMNGVDKVEIVSYSKFNDAKGNELREEAVKMTWNKETVKNANYENFKNIALSKPQNIYKFSDTYYIHIALWKNAKDETKKSIPLAK